MEFGTFPLDPLGGWGQDKNPSNVVYKCQRPLVYQMNQLALFLLTNHLTYKPHCRSFFSFPFAFSLLFRKEKRADRKTDGDLLFSGTISITRVAASPSPSKLKSSSIFVCILPLSYANKSGVKSGPDLLGATSTDIRCRELTRIGIRGHHSACRIEPMFGGRSVFFLRFLLLLFMSIALFIIFCSLEPGTARRGGMWRGHQKYRRCARPPWICRETNKETHSVGVINRPMLSFVFFTL